MSSATARRVATPIAALTIGLVLACQALVLFQHGSGGITRFWPAIYGPMAIVLISLFAVIGWLIVWRQPRNWIGWICLGSGLIVATNIAFALYSLVALFEPSARLSGGLWTAWVVQWLWLPQNTLVFVFLPALFPTGHLPSPKWRAVLWLAVLSTGLLVAAAAVYPMMGLWTGGPSCVWSSAIPGPCYQFANPFPVTLPRPFLDTFIRLTGTLSSLAIALGGASLIARFRTGNVEVRAQLKWLTSAFAVCASCAAGLFVVGTVLHVTVPLLFIALTAAFLAIPLSIGFAMLKYRLYDIDVVISKSLLFGTLAVFIAAVYVAMVVGIGSIIGTGGRPNLGLSIVATAVVAIAFEPIRERLQAVVNRLVYGQRLTPYEVMADFLNRMAGVRSVSEALPTIAEAVKKGLGATGGHVRAFLPNGAVESSGWPQNFVAAQFDDIVPVAYRAESVGEISVATAAGESLTIADRKLLNALATQAGLVLHNLRLAWELQDRIAHISAQAADIHASRQRIVAAQNNERQRLEQAIRNGVDVQLLELKAELRHVETLLSREPSTAALELERLTDHANRILEELRDLARGIYPPLLREQGITPALRAQVEKMHLPIEIASEGLVRYPPEVEAAVYFSCVEALRSAASPARIELVARDEVLEFCVTSTRIELNGRREDIEDRIEALGGTLAVDGDRLTGRIPLAREVSVG